MCVLGTSTYQVFAVNIGLKFTIRIFHLCICIQRTYYIYISTISDIEVAGRLHSLDQSEGKSLIQRQFLSSIPQIDPNVLNDIELEAQYLASNIDNLTENLCNLVHSVRICN